AATDNWLLTGSPAATGGGRRKPPASGARGREDDRHPGRSLAGCTGRGAAGNPVPRRARPPCEDFVMSRGTILGSALEAVADTPDGATVLIGGFGAAGQPVELIEALLASAARELTVVSNNAGNGDTGLAALIRDRRVAKIVCSFPRQSDSWHFDAAWR